MITANSYQYELSAVLYWGSDGKAANRNDIGNKNAAVLLQDNILSFDIYSNLLCPFLYGSMVYRDDKRGTPALKNALDMPMVYLSLGFQRVGLNGNPFGDEHLNEEFLVTGIELVDDREPAALVFKLDFVMKESLKFQSTLAPVSTFTDEETSIVLDDLLCSLFSAAGMAGRFDRKSVTQKSYVQFISNENSTLLTSLPYIYKMLFTQDYSHLDSSRQYVKVVYDHVGRKYVLWNLNEFGTRESVTKSSDKPSEYVITRNMVRCTLDRGRAGGNGRIAFSATPNNACLPQILGNKTFIDYNYLENSFFSYSQPNIGPMFINDTNQVNSDMYNKLTLVGGNALDYKELNFSNAYSTSRNNGSIYDALSELIFGTSYIQVQSEGCIARKAGDSVFLSFPDGLLSPYANLNSSYLVTALRHSYAKMVGETSASFSTHMDVYSPFVFRDSTKSR